MDNNNKEIHIGCGCLTNIIALILLAVLCDLLGCDWSHGVCQKAKDIFFTDNQQTTTQIETK